MRSLLMLVVCSTSAIQCLILINHDMCITGTALDMLILEYAQHAMHNVKKENSVIGHVCERVVLHNAYHLF